MNVVIFGNTYRRETIEQVKILFHTLFQRGISASVEEDFFHFLKNDLGFEPEGVRVFHGNDFSADLALSIGGDGTFLRTASRILEKNIPVLGINTGRLGFLADISGDEIPATFDEILENKFRVEERTLLQIQTKKTGMVYGFALNEIAVSKQDSSSMLTISTKLNGEFLNDYRSDGLIIATPTGSTAYSMSVGGPLVYPESRSLLLSAIAPHSLNVRPFVIPDDFEIELRVSSRSGCFLISIDGRSEVLAQSTPLFIKKSPLTIKVLKRQGHDFYNTLRSKLMWGADKRI